MTTFEGSPAQTSDRSAKLTARTRELATMLVGWPSVTGTADEAAFAQRLAEHLATWPYFRRHPEDLVLAPVPGGRYPRQNLLALVRGEGRRTVALAGHFDVVPVDDYGDLAPLAGRPEALREGLLRRLRGAPSLALTDLESGAFVPGRGMLDMKSGLAAGIAALEQFADEEARQGNLLLLATPDEEDRSAGMRAVAAMLPEFLRTRGLDARLAINLDATCDNGDGAAGRVVAMGCLGKLLLSAFVVGKEGHACYPFDGVNAAHLAAELACAFEAAPELAERTGRELAAPPAAAWTEGSQDGLQRHHAGTRLDVLERAATSPQRRTGIRDRRRARRPRRRAGRGPRSRAGRRSRRRRDADPRLGGPAGDPLRRPARRRPRPHAWARRSAGRAGGRAGAGRFARSAQPNAAASRNRSGPPPARQGRSSCSASPRCPIPRSIGRKTTRRRGSRRRSNAPWRRSPPRRASRSRNRPISPPSPT